MLDVRTFLMNRLSPCLCAEEWGIEGFHGSDCRQQIEREFVWRVTTPVGKPDAGAAQVPENAGFQASPRLDAARSTSPSGSVG
jgi:hypothetical protein